MGRLVAGHAQPHPDEAETHHDVADRHRGEVEVDHGVVDPGGEDEHAGHLHEREQAERDVVRVVAAGEPDVVDPRPPDPEEGGGEPDDGVGEAPLDDEVVQLGRRLGDGDDEAEVVEQLERRGACGAPRRPSGRHAPTPSTPRQPHGPCLAPRHRRAHTPGVDRRSVARRRRATSATSCGRRPGGEQLRRRWARTTASSSCVHQRMCIRCSARSCSTDRRGAGSNGSTSTRKKRSCWPSQRPSRNGMTWTRSQICGPIDDVVEPELLGELAAQRGGRRPRPARCPPPGVPHTDIGGIAELGSVGKVPAHEQDAAVGIEDHGTRRRADPQARRRGRRRASRQSSGVSPRPSLNARYSS